MTKRRRQGAIIRLIEDSQISTQSDLVESLAQKGFEVAQTTVSRDINELGLVKVRGITGHLVYSQSGTPDQDAMKLLAQALESWVLKISSSGNLIVIDTPNGYADPVAQALDRSGHPHVLGTVAGENTVLVIATEGVSGTELVSDLESVANGGQV